LKHLVILDVFRVDEIQNMFIDLALSKK